MHRAQSRRIAIRPQAKNKPNRTLVIFISLVILGLVGLMGGVLVIRKQDADALAKELSFAREKGIPTTWEEFAAQLNKSQPEVNAAPIYRDLTNEHLRKPSGHLISDLLTRPNASANQKAVLWILEHRSDYQKIELACQRPMCSFDRNWSKWPLVPEPELATMKICAENLIFRSACYAFQHQDEMAIRDLKRAVIIANQAESDLTKISNNTQEALYKLVLEQTTLLSLNYPDRKAYVDYMAEVIQSYPIPSSILLVGCKYLDAKSLIQLCQTAEGRKALNLNENEQSASPLVFISAMAQGKADIELVRSCRAMFSACLLPFEYRHKPYLRAEVQFEQAMSAYPGAFRTYRELGLGGDGNDWAVDKVAETHRAMYQSILLFLKSKRQNYNFQIMNPQEPSGIGLISFVIHGNQIQVSASGGNTGINIEQVIIPSIPLRFPFD